MADRLSARIWTSEGTRFSFAERQSDAVPGGGLTGVCFSGGGTRALTAAMGQLRALTSLELVDKIGYISCVSGGSWASTAYTCYREGAASDEEFLGPMTAPQNITMAGLGQLVWVIRRPEVCATRSWSCCTRRCPRTTCGSGPSVRPISNPLVFMHPISRPISAWTRRQSPLLSPAIPASRTPCFTPSARARPAPSW